MKRIGIGVLSLVLCCGAFAQSPSEPRLLGVAKVPKRSFAVIDAPIAKASGSVQTMFLGEGERENESSVEVIDVGNRMVQFTYRGTNMLLTLGGPPVTTSPACDVKLTNAPVHAALRVLSELADKNLLIYPLESVTPAAGLKLSVDARGDAASVFQAFTNVLARRELVVIPDGEKFLIIAPKANAASIEPRSHLITQTNLSAREREAVPPGHIVLTGADVQQMVSTYASMVKRELDSTAQMPSLEPFFFRNQTPLTMAEAKYVYEALFASRGIKAVMDEKVVRLERIEGKKEK